MSLKKFIAQENMVIAMMGNREPSFPENPKDLTTEQKNHLGLCISSALSPESLTCDGELRGAKLHAKARMLHTAKAELEALGVAFPAY